MGALILVKEGVLHRETHDQARGERGQGSGKTAIGHLRVDGLPQCPERDKPIEWHLGGEGLPLAQRSEFDVVVVIGLEARSRHRHNALAKKSPQDCISEGESLCPEG